MKVSMTVAQGDALFDLFKHRRSDKTALSAWLADFKRDRLLGDEVLVIMWHDGAVNAIRQDELDVSADYASHRLQATREERLHARKPRPAGNPESASARTAGAH